MEVIFYIGVNYEREDDLKKLSMFYQDGTCLTKGWKLMTQSEWTVVQIERLS